MAFIRTVKRENPFVQLDKYFIEDPNLSWEAKGILSYMLSRPDNWKINQKDLQNRSTGGKTKVETALVELMANGYCNWYPIRKNDGTVEEWVYDIYERPDYNPKKEECIVEGQRRVEKKKLKNKLKNEKRKLKTEPDGDNPILDDKPQSDYPLLDNPLPDNPVLDNPPINNNDDINIKINNNEGNNNLNPNPIYDDLWNTNLPIKLKQWIKVKIVDKKLLLTSEQILLLEDAYKYQIQNGWIIPDCDSEYQGAINDREFTGSIAKMLDTVKDIQNIRGLVQDWVRKAFDYKATNLLKLSYQREVPFYNWLDQESV